MLHLSQTNLTRWFYWSVILLKFAVAGFAFAKHPLITDNNVLFIIGVVHMLGLCAFGIFTRRAERPLVAQYLKTAGYLHTLFGLVFALTSFSPAVDRFETMMPLVGMSLVTSLIGWFIGGELSRTSSLANSQGTAAVSTAAFLGQANQIQDRYLEAMEASIRTFQAIPEDHKKLLKDLKEDSKRFADAVTVAATRMEGVGIELAKVTSTSSTFNNGAAAVAHSAEALSQALKQTTVLMHRLVRLSDRIAGIPPAN